MSSPALKVEILDETPLSLAQEAVAKLEKKYSKLLEINSILSRSIVSFQANRAEPIFRWFKYREGFSKQLIEYLLDQFPDVPNGLFLDPFAGTGAAAFTAADRGEKSIAVELMPVGCFFMNARQILLQTSREQAQELLSTALKKSPWKKAAKRWSFPHLTITNNAFPSETEESISRYKTWVASLEEPSKTIFDFALFSILEEISFTRKDGQYLRWDSRSPRSRVSGQFNKGPIYDFETAITRKLETMINDLAFFENGDLFSEKKSKKRGEVRVLQGTVFERIADLKNNSVSRVITSPPYCNRYDYTRTYALELAYLGVNEQEIRRLRQTLLTCTVENKPKDFSFVAKDDLALAQHAFDQQTALQAALRFLEDERDSGRLNNAGIVRMVRGYFLDSAIHLAQVAKKMKSGGTYLMVNDNVRYNGLDLPVDCILSDIAENLGFKCEKIWVLPIGKGNSSQQMKRHGRSELRKCVYVWRKL